MSGDEVKNLNAMKNSMSSWHRLRVLDSRTSIHLYVLLSMFHVIYLIFVFILEKKIISSLLLFSRPVMSDSL